MATHATRTRWGNPTKVKKIKRRGVMVWEDHDRHGGHVDIEIRGEGVAMPGGREAMRFSFEVTGQRGLSARSLWVYETEARATADAETIARTILELTR